MSGHISSSLIFKISTLVAQIRNPRKTNENPQKWYFSKTACAIVLELCAKVAHHATEWSWKFSPDKKIAFSRKCIFSCRKMWLIWPNLLHTCWSLCSERSWTSNYAFQQDKKVWSRFLKAWKEKKKSFGQAFLKSLRPQKIIASSWKKKDKKVWSSFLKACYN